jgi:hypothetical protein
VSGEVQTNLGIFTEEVPCMSADDCPYAWSCVGEGRGCPIDGRHKDANL